MHDSFCFCRLCIHLCPWCAYIFAFLPFLSSQSGLRYLTIPISPGPPWCGKGPLSSLFFLQPPASWQRNIRCKTTKKSESSDRGRRGCGHSLLPLASARFRGRVPNPGPTAYCRMRPMGGVRSRSSELPARIRTPGAIGSSDGGLLHPRGVAGRFA